MADSSRDSTFSKAQIWKKYKAEQEGLDENEESLDVEQLRSDVRNVFASGGIFSTKLNNYSPRQGQIELADIVAQSLGDNSKILMVEAGTGTGKTFSYLVPPILANKRIIVSTGTKALQDQLVDKDIPNLLKILGRQELMFMGLKGHSNYICRLMVDELSDFELSSHERGMVNSYIETCLDDLPDFFDHTTTGVAPNFAELKFKMREDQRRLVTCDSLACQKRRKDCPYVHKSSKDKVKLEDECFVTAARKFAQQCSLITINHALFFASLGVSRPVFQQPAVQGENPNQTTSGTQATQGSQAQAQATAPNSSTQNKAVPAGKIYLVHPSEIAETISKAMATPRNEIKVDLTQPSDDDDTSQDAIYDEAGEEADVAPNKPKLSVTDIMSIIKKAKDISSPEYSLGGGSNQQQVPPSVIPDDSVAQAEVGQTSCENLDSQAHDVESGTALEISPAFSQVQSAPKTQAKAKGSTIASESGAYNLALCANSNPLELGLTSGATTPIEATSKPKSKTKKDGQATSGKRSKSKFSYGVAEEDMEHGPAHYIDDIKPEDDLFGGLEPINANDDAANTDRVMNMLPKPDVLVFDEAHTVAEVGRSFYTRSYNRSQLKDFVKELKGELGSITGYIATPDVAEAINDIVRSLDDLDRTFCSLPVRRYDILEFKYLHADGVNYVKVQKDLFDSLGVAVADIGGLGMFKSLQSGESGEKSSSGASGVSGASGAGAVTTPSHKDRAYLEEVVVVSEKVLEVMAKSIPLVKSAQPLTIDASCAVFGFTQPAVDEFNNESIDYDPESGERTYYVDSGDTFKRQWTPQEQPNEGNLEHAQEEVLLTPPKKFKRQHYLDEQLDELEYIGTHTNKNGYTNFSLLKRQFREGKRQEMIQEREACEKAQEAYKEAMQELKNTGTVDPAVLSVLQEQQRHEEQKRQQKYNGVPNFAITFTTPEEEEQQRLIQNASFNQGSNQGQVLGNGQGSGQSAGSGDSGQGNNGNGGSSRKNGSERSRSAKSQSQQQPQQQPQQLQQPQQTQQTQQEQQWPQGAFPQYQQPQGFMPPQGFAQPNYQGPAHQFMGQVPQGTQGQQGFMQGAYAYGQGSQAAIQGVQGIPQGAQQGISQGVPQGNFTPFNQGHAQYQGHNHPNQGYNQDHGQPSYAQPNYQQGGAPFNPIQAQNYAPQPNFAPHQFQGQGQGQGGQAPAQWQNHNVNGLNPYVNPNFMQGAPQHNGPQGQMQQPRQYSQGSVNQEHPPYVNPNFQQRSNLGTAKPYPHGMMPPHATHMPQDGHNERSRGFAQNHHGYNQGYNQHAQTIQGHNHHQVQWPQGHPVGQGQQPQQAQAGYNQGQDGNQNFNQGFAQPPHQPQVYQAQGAQPHYPQQGGAQAQGQGYQSSFNLQVRSGTFNGQGPLGTQVANGAQSSQGYHDASSQAYGAQSQGMRDKAQGQGRIYDNRGSGQGHSGNYHSQNQGAYTQQSVEAKRDIPIVKRDEVTLSSSWKGQSSFIESQMQGVKASKNNPSPKARTKTNALQQGLHVQSGEPTQGSSSRRGSGYDDYKTSKSSYSGAKASSSFKSNSTSNKSKYDEPVVEYVLDKYGNPQLNMDFRYIVVKLAKALVLIRDYTERLRDKENETEVNSAQTFIDNMLNFITDLMTTDRDKFGTLRDDFVAWVMVKDPRQIHHEDLGEEAEARMKRAAEDRAAHLGKEHDEPKENDFEITLAPIEIGRFLGPELKRLTQSGISVVFASATITTCQDFSKFCYDLGLGLDDVTTKIVESPFNYSQNARILYSRDFLDVSVPDRMLKHVQKLKPVIDASPGGVFFLTTSYASLAEAEQACTKYFGGRRNIYVQNKDSVNNLMDAFRRDGHGILIGTSSFWEGVDVPGQALSLVIIDKLPFKIANDPVNKARSAIFERVGKNSFYAIAVPEAIIKFRQGVGRLIRNEKDLGALIILDPRIETKRYGREFVESLPPMTKVNRLEDIIEFFDYIKEQQRQGRI